MYVNSLLNSAFEDAKAVAREAICLSLVALSSVGTNGSILLLFLCITSERFLLLLTSEKDEVNSLSQYHSKCIYFLTRVQFNFTKILVSIKYYVTWKSILLTQFYVLQYICEVYGHIHLTRKLIITRRIYKGSYAHSMSSAE